VENLNWTSHKELLSNLFILEFQQIYDEMILIRLKEIDTLMEYDLEFNVQLSVIPKLDELAKKIIFFNGLQSWIDQEFA